jgi:hypothetical protein
MRLRSIKLVSHPVVEPVSLAEARAQVRLHPDQTDDDLYLTGLIATGRRLVERRLGIALVAQQYRARFDNEEPPVDWRLAASFMPTLSIMSTQYRAALGIVEPYVRLPVSPLLVDGTHPIALSINGTTTVDPSNYTADTDSMPGIVRFTTVPTLAAKEYLEVTFWAGIAAGQPIPPQLKSAILLYVGHLYIHREAVSDTSAVELPMAFETLLASESITGAW